MLIIHIDYSSYLRSNGADSLMSCSGAAGLKREFEPACCPTLSLVEHKSGLAVMNNVQKLNIMSRILRCSGITPQDEAFYEVGKKRLVKWNSFGDTRCGMRGPKLSFCAGRYRPAFGRHKPSVKNIGEVSVESMVSRLLSGHDTRHRLSCYLASTIAG